MKTAEELYNEHISNTERGRKQRTQGLSLGSFTEALTEDRQQIKDMIDEMIEKSYKVPDVEKPPNTVTRQQNARSLTKRMAIIETLTELRSRL